MADTPTWALWIWAVFIAISLREISSQLSSIIRMMLAKMD